MIELLASKRAALIALSIVFTACGEESEPEAASTGNMPPAISGTPPTTVAVGTTYSFAPTATDPNSDPLVFGVDGKPAWLQFDTVNGRLSGTPSMQNRGRYRGIVVWVTDGVDQSLLPAFDIEVMDDSPGGNSAPTMSGSPPGSVLAGNAYAFTPTASDADGDTLTFSVQNLPPWATFNSALGRVAGSPNIGDAGLYQNIVISASDGQAGTALPPFDIVVRVPNVNTPPTITGTPSTFVLQGAPYAFQPVANDVDGDALSFSIANRPAWATFNTATGRLSGTPTANHVGVDSNIAISVSDGAATATLPSFSVTVTATNAPPTISGNPAAVVLENAAYLFQPSAGDADGDALTFSISGMPGWATFSALTGRLQGTPSPADVGSYPNIAIAVSDGAATASLAPFSITVTAVNDPPTISGTPALTVDAGMAYSFVPQASDPDGDNLTFSISNRPNWAVFDGTTGRLSGTPGSGDVGVDANIAISVSDGSLSDSLPSFSITVVGNNAAPVISGAAPASVLQDAAYAFTPTASDPDGDSLTFSIVNRPSWATFNTSTGALQGTPTAGHVGSYGNIGISVSDGTASTALPAFSITVNAIALGSATLTWLPPTQYTDGSPLGNDLAGYKVYWGTTSGSYSNSVTISNPGVTTYLVDNLTSGTYYFSTKAYNTQGVESVYSVEASKTIP